MKDYVQLWFEHLRQLTPAGVRSRIEITGEFDKHLGPTWPKAAVSLVVEPAEEFEIIDEVEGNEALEDVGHPDYIMFGLLSVLMTAYSQPVLKIKIILKSVKIDPVETSRMAFELAGRDAGRKIIAAMKAR